MTKRFIDVEVFRKTKDLDGADGVLKHGVLAVTKASEVKRVLEGAAKAGTLKASPSAELGEREILFIMSDGSVDRYGDTIDPKGWIVENWLKSGSWLWAHNPYELPVAKAVAAFLFEGALYGIARFPTAEVYDFADTCYKLILDGTLQGCSVGFRPLKWTFNEDPARRGGIDFIEVELLECSLTPVPANVNAVAVQKMLGAQGAHQRSILVGVDTSQVETACKALSALVERAEAAVAVLKGIGNGPQGLLPAPAAEPAADAPIVASRAGKVLSRANQDKLEQARALIQEVVDSANKSKDDDSDDEGDEEPMDEDKSAVAATPPAAPDQNSVAGEKVFRVDDVKQFAIDLYTEINATLDAITD